MSTRSVIARPTGDGFAGRYHHRDGYPEGLGAELWGLFHSRYGGDLDAMTAELIDAHPAGWSCIVGADWSQEPGFVESMNYVCSVCGLPSGTGHYRQYLAKDDPRRAVPEDGSYLYADHAPERPNVPPRPQCYCHGERGEDEQTVTSWGDDCGTEWAYVLSPGGLMVCERRWIEDGSHMTGMFGMGAGEDGGAWLPIGLYRWDGPEPDWAVVSGAVQANA